MNKTSPAPAETLVKPEPLTEEQADAVAGGLLFPWGNGGCQACCPGADPWLISNLSNVINLAT